VPFPSLDASSPPTQARIEFSEDFLKQSVMWEWRPFGNDCARLEFDSEITLR
jgi:hypothetical protein